MDGNGRWSKKNNLIKIQGHERGAEVAKTISLHAQKHGVKHLTLYTFSAENWNRPEQEVWGVMKLLKYYLKKDKATISQNNIKLNIIGDRTKLTPDLNKTLDELIDETASNTAMTLNIALSYGSRQEITNAAKQLAIKCLNNQLSPNDINEEVLSKELYTAQTPDPDLLIRTGQEKRISNFLLWQISYTELYFSDILWPDFTSTDFDIAVEDYNNRNRRYGR